MGLAIVPLATGGCGVTQPEDVPGADEAVVSIRGGGVGHLHGSREAVQRADWAEGLEDGVMGPCWSLIRVPEDVERAWP